MTTGDAPFSTSDPPIGLPDVATLLRGPLAASRALLELLSSQDDFDPDMVHGYLTPALQQVQIACELVEDAMLLTDEHPGAALEDDPEAIVIDAAIGAAAGNVRIGGELLPTPEPASDEVARVSSELRVIGHRRLLDRLLRCALELAAAHTANGATRFAVEPVPGDRETTAVDLIVEPVGAAGPPCPSRRVVVDFRRAVADRLAIACDTELRIGPNGVLRLRLPAEAIRREAA